MAVIISSVEKNSLSYLKGIQGGDTLLKINSHEIFDVLDYQFYIKETRLVLDFKTCDNKYKRIAINKSESEDIGLCFETYLMDKQIHCKNKCVFCFIDQMPKGMRESLYFKDDDSRLSFLFGNYITLTNLNEHDVERIIEMHISPVNVSVHTMNPELRVQMMKNKNAGKSLEILKRLADAGIKLNTQLVLCPGINDGKELEYSLSELAKLYPSIESIACVPVGLTKFRQNLSHLEEYNETTAGEVIDIVDSFSNSFKKEHGTRLAFCSDEFYIISKRPIPSEEYYEDYLQIENGVGLCRSLEEEFVLALSDAKADNEKRTLDVATGVAAYPLINSLCQSFCEKFKNTEICVHEIKNDFFGNSITVAGLITGGDLKKQLSGKIKGERLLIPSVMLRSEQDVFLDDVSLEELSNELDVKIETVSNDGYDLFDKIFG